MSEILKRCQALETVFNQEIAANRVYGNQLDERAQVLNDKEQAQKEESAALELREVNIVPSERLIERELACDKKEREALEAQDKAVKMAESANTIIAQERKIINSASASIKQREKALGERINEQNNKEKNFKAKIIAAVEKGKV